MSGSALAGTWRLVRFALRRDRVRLAIWVVGLAGVIAVSGVSLLDVYPTQMAIDGYVRLFGDNPALVVFAGPGHGFDDPNIGVILVNETQLWGMIGVALMSMFLVTRHTRAEEESERAELLRSLVVGRHASVAAATVVVSSAVLAVAAASGAAFVASGYPVAGSVALAGSYLAVGLVFVGVTAVAAQMASTARGALGLSAVALLVAFVVRAIGDIGTPWLSWCSPIGWAQAVRAYADERWWVLALCVAAAVALVAGAFWLSTRRDLGAGLVRSRVGRKHARPWTTRPIGLAVRMARGLVLGWMVGLFVTGLVFGAIADDIDELLADNPEMADFFAQLGGGSLTDAYLATALTMLGLIASGLSVATVLVAHGDEQNGRAEWVLAGPLSRGRWLASHVVVSVMATVAALVAAGLGVGVAYASVTGDVGQVTRLLSGALLHVPAALVLAGAAVAVFGVAPRAALLGWLPFVVGAVVVFFGEVLQLPRWLRDLSPFEHVPAFVVVGWSAGPPAVLVALAAGLAAIGWWGLRRRDLAPR